MLCPTWVFWLCPTNMKSIIDTAKPLLKLWIHFLPILFKNIYVVLFYMCQCCNYMYIWVPCVYSVHGGQKRVLDHCESPCGCWKPNLDPLEEWQVLLTTDPSLYALCLFYYKLKGKTSIKEILFLQKCIFKCT